MNSEDRLILVAGGTGGLGRAVALTFLVEGARVAVTYRAAAELEALTRAAGEDAVRISGHPTDVTNHEAVGTLVDELVARHGRLDALVNTVGAYAGGAKLWEMDAETLDRMLLANLRSGYVLARAAVPVMLKQGHGAIVNVASRAALVHGPGESAYAASKAAAVALIDSLAADLKGTGVRANSILPGIIDTEANRRAMPKADFSKWPKPEEIARVVLFLCGDDAKLIHGAAIPVYGQS
ncbi:MAG TPA: SDR family NAD(P)-dependent oxidoreductase [Thermoanaerobaculia bacterium]|nr:SDR family NAD(P)-dependent oxidoreductase [Thermoanaerobaculia bacterium]